MSRGVLDKLAGAPPLAVALDWSDPGAAYVVTQETRLDPGFNTTPFIARGLAEQPFHWLSHWKLDFEDPLPVGAVVQSARFEVTYETSTEHSPPARGVVITVWAGDILTEFNPGYGSSVDTTPFAIGNLLPVLQNQGGTTVGLVAGKKTLPVDNPLNTGQQHLIAYVTDQAIEPATLPAPSGSFSTTFTTDDGYYEITLDLTYIPRRAEASTGNLPIIYGTLPFLANNTVAYHVTATPLAPQIASGLTPGSVGIYNTNNGIQLIGNAQGSGGNVEISQIIGGYGISVDNNLGDGTTFSTSSRAAVITEFNTDRAGAKILDMKVVRTVLMPPSAFRRIVAVGGAQTFVLGHLVDAFEAATPIVFTAGGQFQISVNPVPPGSFGIDAFMEVVYTQDTTFLPQMYRFIGNGDLLEYVAEVIGPRTVRYRPPPGSGLSITEGFGPTNVKVGGGRAVAGDHWSYASVNVLVYANVPDRHGPRFVDWGDGSPPAASVISALHHTYEASGQFTVKVQDENGKYSYLVKVSGGAVAAPPLQPQGGIKMAAGESVVAYQDSRSGVS